MLGWVGHWIDLSSCSGQWDLLGGAEGTWQWGGGGCRALGSSASLQHLLGADGACCWLPHQQCHLHHGMGLGYLTRGSKQLGFPIGKDVGQDAFRICGCDARDGVCRGQGDGMGMGKV